MPGDMSFCLFPKRVFTLYQRSTTRFITGLLAQRKCVVHLNRLMGVRWPMRMILNANLLKYNSKEELF